MNKTNHHINMLLIGAIYCSANIVYDNNEERIEDWDVYALVSDNIVQSRIKIGTTKTIADAANIYKKYGFQQLTADGYLINPTQLVYYSVENSAEPGCGLFNMSFANGVQIQFTRSFTFFQQFKSTYLSGFESGVSDATSL